MVCFYPAIAALFFFWDSIRIIPEVKSVYILKVKPKPYMMWMIGGVTGACSQGKAPGDNRSAGSSNGKQHRLFQCIRIQESSKRLPPDSNRYLLCIFVLHYLYHLLFLGKYRCNKKTR